MRHILDPPFDPRFTVPMPEASKSIHYWTGKVERLRRELDRLEREAPDIIERLLLSEESYGHRVTSDGIACRIKAVGFELHFARVNLRRLQHPE